MYGSVKVSWVIPSPRPTHSDLHARASLQAHRFGDKKRTTTWQPEALKQGPDGHPVTVMLSVCLGSGVIRKLLKMLSSGGRHGLLPPMKHPKKVHTGFEPCLLSAMGTAHAALRQSLPCVLMKSKTRSPEP